MGLSNNSRQWWLLLILLVAASLRLVAIDSVPPGVTHDEADHALDAWGVVEGNRPVYFTTSYGREPLYDYATAVIMNVVGRSYFAGRLTAALFGLLLVASTYTWTQLLFNRTTALYATAAMAVGFWSIMVSRHGLRTIALPALFNLALAGYLHLLHKGERWRRKWIITAVLTGLLLGATFYTYIPARVLWLLLPLYTVLIWRQKKGLSLPQKRWVSIVLTTALLSAVPLITYFVQNPNAEARLGQLNMPLQQALEGNWTPLLENAVGALQLITIQGDTAWRYNIAGRPFLPGPAGWLFYLGLLLLLAAVAGRIRHLSPTSAIFTLSWLVVGLLPAMITGPELATTQAVGMLPIIYLIPAIALDQLIRWLHAWQPAMPRAALLGGGLALLLLFGINSSRDYFSNWATAPEVRVQYESSLVTTLRTLVDNGSQTAAIATTTLDPLHSPAVAPIILDNELTISWFDAHASLLIPAGNGSQVVFSGFSPLNERLAAYITLPATSQPVELPLSDEDRPVTIYTLNQSEQRQAISERITLLPLPAHFDAAVALLGYDIIQVEETSTLQIVTFWEVTAPLPTDEIQFVHLLNGAGEIVAQVDRLDVASQSWQPGDLFLQLHTVSFPPELPAGDYSVRTGLYHCLQLDCSQSARLPIMVDGEPAGDSLTLTAISIGTQIDE